MEQVGVRKSKEDLQAEVITFLNIQKSIAHFVLLRVKIMGWPQCKRHRRHRFNPWVRKIPWRRKWQATPVFLPGKFHEQRSLAVCSPEDCMQLIARDGQHYERPTGKAVWQQDFLLTSNSYSVSFLTYIFTLWIQSYDQVL